MNLENAKAQMRKGVLEYCILLMLSQRDAYASDIIQQLKSIQMIVVEGTLYPLLTRLKNAELLSYRWEESLQGPPRKYYMISEKGKNFLQELESTWAILQTAVRHLENKDNTL